MTDEPNSFVARFALPLARFHFPAGKDDFVRPITEIAAKMTPSFRALADAFAINLAAANSVAAMPYRMATSAVSRLRFQAIHSAQRIRSLKSDYQHLSEDERNHWALETARQKFAEERAADKDDAIADPPGKFARAVLEQLEDLLSDAEFSESVDELLRQCTVLCWGALEVLAADLFVALLNVKPSLARFLLHDARTKKYYQSRDFGAALEERNYDLSSSMGDVLIGQRRIDDVETIRGVFDVLFPECEELRISLSDEKLWMLSQARNLIVHRRAIIDRQYVANTGSSLALGAPLTVGPDMFEGYLTYVRSAGLVMLNAVA